MLIPSDLFGQKVKPGRPPMEGKILYISFSPLRDFNLQFLFGSASKTFTAMEKVHRRIITGPILRIRVFNRIYYCRVAKELS